MTCAAERVDTSSTTINAMSTLPNTLSAAVNDNMQVSQETVIDYKNNIDYTKTNECLVASNYYVNGEKEAGDNNSSDSDDDEVNNDDLDELADFYSSKSNVRKVLFTNLPCNMPQSHLENNNKSENKEIIPKELCTLQDEEKQSVKKHILQDNLRVHEMTMHKRRELHERKLQWRAWNHLNLHKLKYKRHNATRALILSANVLWSAITAVQLKSMGGWSKVDEANNLNTATGLLLEQILETSRRGYTVARIQGASHSKIEKEKEKQHEDNTRKDEQKKNVNISKQGVHESHSANGYSKYANNSENLNKLFTSIESKMTRKYQREREKDKSIYNQWKDKSSDHSNNNNINSKSNNSSKCSATPDSKTVSNTNDSAETKTYRSKEINGAGANAMNDQHSNESDSDESENESVHSSVPSSVCSAEQVNSSDEEEDNDNSIMKNNKRRGTKRHYKVSKTPPPDFIAQLILVDSFSHDNAIEVARNLRHLDEQYELNLVLIYINNDCHFTTYNSDNNNNNNANTDSKENYRVNEMEGVGKSVMDGVMHHQHNNKQEEQQESPSTCSEEPNKINTTVQILSLEEAYEAGFDLVLNHRVDQSVIHMLGNAFFSYSSRWLNNMRAQSIIGNYMSLKSILQMKDIAELKKLIYTNPHSAIEEYDGVNGYPYETTAATAAGNTNHYDAYNPINLFTSQSGVRDVQQEELMRLMQNSMEYVKTKDDQLNILMQPTSSMKHTCKVKRHSLHRLGNTTYGVNATLSQPLSRSGRLSRNRFITNNTNNALNNSGVYGRKRRMGSQHGNRPRGNLTGSQGNSLMESSPLENKNNTNYEDLEQSSSSLYYGEDSDRHESEFNSMNLDEYDYVLVDQNEANIAVITSTFEEEMARLMSENTMYAKQVQELTQESERLQRTIHAMKRLNGYGRNRLDGEHNNNDEFDDEENGNDEMNNNGGLGGNANRPSSGPGGTMTNLSKEQQIYILKERLEAANERILLLLSSNNIKRKTGAGMMGKLTNNNNSMLERESNEDRINARFHGRGGNNGKNAIPPRRMRNLVLRYLAKQESNTMNLLDMDANTLQNYNNNEEDDLYNINDNNKLANELKYKKVAKKMHHEVQDNIEELHFVMNDLQKQIDVMQEANNGDFTMTNSEHALLEAKLHNALDLLHCQRERVTQLEQLRAMDAAELNRLYAKLPTSERKGKNKPHNTKKTVMRDKARNSNSNSLLYEEQEEEMYKKQGKHKNKQTLRMSASLSSSSASASTSTSQLALTLSSSSNPLLHASDKEQIQLPHVKNFDSAQWSRELAEIRSKINKLGKNANKTSHLSSSKEKHNTKNDLEASSSDDDDDEIIHDGVLASTDSLGKHNKKKKNNSKRSQLPSLTPPLLPPQSTSSRNQKKNASSVHDSKSNKYTKAVDKLIRNKKKRRYNSQSSSDSSNDDNDDEPIRALSLSSSSSCSMLVRLNQRNKEANRHEQELAYLMSTSSEAQANIQRYFVELEELIANEFSKLYLSLYQFMSHQLSSIASNKKNDVEENASHVDVYNEITNTEADVNALRTKLQDVIDQHDLEKLLNEDENSMKLHKDIKIAEEFDTLAHRYVQKALTLSQLRFRLLPEWTFSQLLVARSNCLPSCINTKHKQQQQEEDATEESREHLSNIATSFVNMKNELVESEIVKLLEVKGNEKDTIVLRNYLRGVIIDERNDESDNYNDINYNKSTSKETEHEIEKTNVWALHYHNIINALTTTRNKFMRDNFLASSMSSFVIQRSDQIEQALRERKTHETSEITNTSLNVGENEDLNVVSTSAPIKEDAPEENQEWSQEEYHMAVQKEVQCAWEVIDSYNNHHKNLQEMISLLTMLFPKIIPPNMENKVQPYNSNNISKLCFATEVREMLMADNALILQIVKYLSQLPHSVQASIRSKALSLMSANTNNDNLNELFDLAHMGSNANDRALKSLYERLTTYSHSTPTGRNENNSKLEENETGMSAEEIAALFSRASGHVDGEHNMDDLYFDLSSINNNNEDNTIISDENAHMMQAIKQELFYLNSLRTQRLAELQLRYELARQNKLENAMQGKQGSMEMYGDELEAYRTRAGNEVQQEEEVENDEEFIQRMKQINFTIAEAAPSMYGMSAKRRLRDILLRRKSPEQIILNGMNYGDYSSSSMGDNNATTINKDGVSWSGLHSTSNEVSSRSARRAFLESELDYIQDRDHLFALKQQQQLLQKGINNNLDQRRILNAANFLPRINKSRKCTNTQEEQSEYEQEQRRQLEQMQMRNRELDTQYNLNTPRDAASYHAFNEVTSLFGFDGVNRYNNNNKDMMSYYYKLPALQERLYEFKMLLKAAQSRIYSFLSPNPSIQNEKIREKLGEPFVMPFAISGKAIRMNDRNTLSNININNNNNNNTANSKKTQQGKVQNRVPLEHTTWNYGVPINDALSMLTRSVENEEEEDEDGENENKGKHTGVLFVPAGLRANASEPHNNTYNATSKKTGNAHEEEKLFKWQQTSSTINNSSRSKRDLENEQQLLMLLQNSTASSSALAANRLSQLFALSMRDPTIGDSLSQYNHINRSASPPTSSLSPLKEKTKLSIKGNKLLNTNTSMSMPEEVLPTRARTFQEYQRQHRDDIANTPLDPNTQSKTNKTENSFTNNTYNTSRDRNVNSESERKAHEECHEIVRTTQPPSPRLPQSTPTQEQKNNSSPYSEWAL